MKPKIQKKKLKKIQEVLKSKQKYNKPNPQQEQTVSAMYIKKKTKILQKLSTSCDIVSGNMAEL